MCVFAAHEYSCSSDGCAWLLRDTRRGSGALFGRIPLNVARSRPLGPMHVPFRFADGFNNYADFDASDNYVDPVPDWHVASPLLLPVAHARARHH